MTTPIGSSDGEREAFEAWSAALKICEIGESIEWAAWQARAAIPDPKVARLLAAAKELSVMYAHAWDMVDGGLMMLQPSIPRFEAAHREINLAICAITGEAPLVDVDEDETSTALSSDREMAPEAEAKDSVNQTGALRQEPVAVDEMSVPIEPTHEALVRDIKEAIGALADGRRFPDLLDAIDKLAAHAATTRRTGCRCPKPPGASSAHIAQRSGE